MKFLIDSQLPTFPVDQLRRLGHEADHLRGFALQRADDPSIWRLALERQAVVVTKDRDFAMWAAARRPCPQVVWLRTGNETNDSLSERLDRCWPRIVAELESGVQVVEVGRE